jgi:uncharacterized repeat protein (TIGR01451 family)
MWPRSVFKGRRNIALLFPGNNNHRRTPIGVTLQHLGLALMGVLVVAAGVLPCTAAENRELTVSVARRDLRPLALVTAQLSGAVNGQGVTDENGRVAFPGLPPAGAITVTPSRSGFRFEPPQLTIPDSVNPATAVFTAFPTATDLALSIVTDNPNPLVGGLVNGVITLRNLGAAAATDIAVAMGSLPGLVLEARDTTQGTLQSRAYDTVWTLAQLNPGASAEVHYRARATLAEANVLAFAQLEEMDQTDTAPLNNTAYLSVPTRAAQARLSLTMTINPATAKVGETLPVRVTVRNDGPQDATQVAIQSYTPPGASFLDSADPLPLSSSVVLRRLAPGAEAQLNGTLMVRMAGPFTLIANVTSFEQQLPPGAAWPEARADYTVQPASSRLTLLGFTDPPNPRVGDDVTVMYVVKNEGPDPVTGLQLFPKADWRLSFGYRFIDPNPPVPPVPGPFVFGGVLPVGAYTYIRSRYLVKAAGDLTNYFTVEYQDQLIPNAADHPELYISIKTLPADVALSLDANPRDITVALGDPVTIDFRVHNDGPQPARGVLVDYSSLGLAALDLDEVIHADRVVRPGVHGYIDIVEPGETVLLRKHLYGSYAGDYTNAAEIDVSSERPDLLMPIAMETIQVHVLPGPPPNLAIGVNVDKPQVNVGEYAIFIVTVTNRAAQPAFSVIVRETDSFDVDSAFETVRSYGPGGDDRIGTAYRRTIPRIEPGASYSMSRTMRVRKPVSIPYLAKIESVNGLIESEIPPWNATTQVAGVQVTSDIAPIVIADRTNVKNGDLVNFAVIARNMSSRMASHPVFDAAQSAGFQLLSPSLSDYGFFWNHNRPQDLQSSQRPLWEWYEVRPQEELLSWLSAYIVDAGQFTANAQLTWLDQLDGQANNDLGVATITSASASASVSVQQSILPQNPSVGDLVRFITEIRNEGPDRVTGLCVTESSSANLELNVNPAVVGDSGDLQTSIWDSLVRLPALKPRQNFVWQRTYVARSDGSASRRVRVERVDQTAGALPDNTAQLTVQPAQADLELQFLEVPTVAQDNIPAVVAVRVRNLGPAVATGVKVAVNVPWDALYLSTFTYGPRATYSFLETSAFQTALMPGESASVGFYVTPLRTGTATSFVQVEHSDQADPNPANNTLSWTLDIGPEPPIPTILRVRKVRTDFFKQTSIAEVEIDQAALNRLAPLSIFYLDRSSNLVDWEYLRLVGFVPLAPVTFTDHSEPGVTMRAYRLRTF